ncbi:MAG: right-handed parallel beta-helix repeat-containing protein, partial [Anaerolineae bacterium]
SGFRKCMVVVGVLALVVPLLLAFAAPVSAATVTVCSAGPPTCNYATITTAVAGETYPATINVYPGTYNESVDLYKAGGGGITLNAVNAGGTPTPGTATVDGGTTGPAFYTSSTHSGNVTINGFIVKTDSASGDDGIRLGVNSSVVIRNVTASNTGEDGIQISEAGGNVTIANCTANSNDSDGILVESVGGDVSVSDCTANNNHDENFDIGYVTGNLEIKRCTANSSEEDQGFDVDEVGGNVTITDSTANNNDDEGIDVDEVGMAGSGESAAGGDDLEDPEPDDEDGHPTTLGYSVNPSANGGDVIIRNCTANGNEDDGIHVDGAGGNVTIANCKTNSNDDNGIDVDWVDGNVALTDCEATENEWSNITSEGVGGNYTITRCSATKSVEDHGIDIWDIDGNLEIIDCVIDENASDNLLVRSTDQEEGRVDGDVIITRCSTSGSQSDDGIEISWVQGKVTISSCIARDNLDDGIDLSYLEEADSILVNANIICGNVSDGLELAIDVEPEEAAVAATSADATGNWWGCAGGPGAAGCDTVSEIDGSVDFTPWIQSITSGASVDPATVGSPTNITFLFSGGPPAVYLGKGPGDLHGDPTFLVTTDNGVVTSSGFIGDSPGTLEVTLTPAHAGTATVWVDGPCGLDESIVLGVVAAVEFVPEPGSVLLLGSGLVGLAGYAGLRLRKR